MVDTYQGWPPNADGTRSVVITCAVAGRAYQGPDLVVPEGMALLIKAYPTNGIGSLIYVAGSDSESVNINSSHPLIPNEPITVFVKNANVFYVSSNIATSAVVFTAEQRKG